MSVRAVPGGFEAFRRDKYGYRRRRIFKTKAQAIAYDESIRRQRKKKGIPQEGPAILTVKEFLGTQIDQYRLLVTKGKARIGTTENLVSLLNTMPSWLQQTTLPKLTRAKCQRYLKELQKPSSTPDSSKNGTPRTRAINTCRGRFKIFRAQLERAVSDDLMSANPAREIELPPATKGDKVVDEEDALTFRELKTVLDVRATRLCGKLYVLFAVMAMTGMRGGEARSLIRDDIELDFRDAETAEPQPRIWVRRTENRGLLGPPKTGGTRSVDVSSQLGMILEWWLSQMSCNPNTWLFEDEQQPDPDNNGHARMLTNQSKLPLSYKTLSDAWYSILKDPGVGIMPIRRPDIKKSTKILF